MVFTLAGPVWGAANLVCVEIILVRGRVVINKAEEDGLVTAATSHNLTKTLTLSEIQLKSNLSNLNFITILISTAFCVYVAKAS